MRNKKTKKKEGKSARGRTRIVVGHGRVRLRVDAPHFSSTVRSIGLFFQTKIIFPWQVHGTMVDCGPWSMDGACILLAVGLVGYTLSLSLSLSLSLLLTPYSLLYLRGGTKMSEASSYFFVVRVEEEEEEDKFKTCERVKDLDGDLVMVSAEKARHVTETLPLASLSLLLLFTFLSASATVDLLVRSFSPSILTSFFSSSSFTSKTVSGGVHPRRDVRPLFFSRQRGSQKIK